MYLLGLVWLLLTPMSTTRSRMPSEESRAAAMDAARALLIEAGPQAVTLKAVGARIGRTHANLLHHFGFAAGLPPPHPAPPFGPGGGSPDGPRPPHRGAGHGDDRPVGGAGAGRQGRSTR